MDLKNYTQVLIDGKVYTLGGSEDEGYLQKAASYVNEKNSAMRKIPGFTKQSADYQMVMTELNIADDYFKAMERAEEMERQKNNMEKETYSLKHELVSTQMKLEAVLKDLEERQRELDRYSRKTAELEGELKEARESVQELRRRGVSETKQPIAEGSVRIQTEEAEEIKRTEEISVNLVKDTDAASSNVVSDGQSMNTGAQTAGQGLDAEQSQTAAQAPQTAAQAPQTVAQAPQAAAAQAAATAVSTATVTPLAGGISDEELARKALQAARKAGSHKGGRR